jgi:hypothetical protein
VLLVVYVPHEQQHQVALLGVPMVVRKLKVGVLVKALAPLVLPKAVNALVAVALVVFA